MLDRTFAFAPEGLHDLDVSPLHIVQVLNCLPNTFIFGLKELPRHVLAVCEICTLWLTVRESFPTN